MRMNLALKSSACWKDGNFVVFLLQWIFKNVYWIVVANENLEKTCALIIGRIDTTGNKEMRIDTTALFRLELQNKQEKIFILFFVKGKNQRVFHWRSKPVE